MGAEEFNYAEEGGWGSEHQVIYYLSIGALHFVQGASSGKFHCAHKDKATMENMVQSLEILTVALHSAWFNSATYHQYMSI